MSREERIVLLLLFFALGNLVGAVVGVHEGRDEGRRAGYTAAVDSVRAVRGKAWELGYWQGIAACDSEWLAVHDLNDYERRLAQTRRRLTEGGR